MYSYYIYIISFRFFVTLPTFLYNPPERETDREGEKERYRQTERERTLTFDPDYWIHQVLSFFQRAKYKRN